MSKKTIEYRTEKIARAICLRRGEDEGLWELHLSTAYALVISSKEIAAKYERDYDDRKKKKAKKDT
jgi:hypothetical protein